MTERFPQPFRHRQRGPDLALQVDQRVDQLVEPVAQLDVRRKVVPSQPSETLEGRQEFEKHTRSGKFEEIEGARLF